ncbi:MAG: 50S ribosomal protein L29 [Patescibacteria group bacterium]|nr:50S ribosomal protein L29 [Patescibacteria group bacterium]
MKTKDKKEIFTKKIPELKAMLKEAKDALFNLKMDHAQKKLKNAKSIFEKKKEIARIMTAIKEAGVVNK